MLGSPCHGARGGEVPAELGRQAGHAHRAEVDLDKRVILHVTGAQDQARVGNDRRLAWVGAEDLSALYLAREPQGLKTERAAESVQSDVEAGDRGGVGEEGLRGILPLSAFR